jgi:UDP-N-acetylglucosamine 2-epimerase (non-hydrolysing)
MIAIVVGTRPDIIQMSPLIRECERRALDYYILHTGQHYSYDMDTIFFEEMDLPRPTFNLQVGSGTSSGQVSRILIGAEQVFSIERPDVVLVAGGSNSAFGTALAASHLQIKVGHIGAGERNSNQATAEEVNRVLIDHLADLLYTSTKGGKGNLIREGIRKKGISTPGSPILDAVYQNLERTRKFRGIFRDLGIKRREYLLATIHHHKNISQKSRLSGIIEGLERVGEDLSLPVVVPVHPVTNIKMKEYGISSDLLQFIPPLGYLEFLQVEGNTRMVLTDSSGVQMECCILGVPCVTLLEGTEKGETLEIGSNVLAGTDPTRILAAVRRQSKSKRWKNPYGDGKSGETIIKQFL